MTPCGKNSGLLMNPIANWGLDLNTCISAPTGEETIRQWSWYFNEAFGFPSAAPSLLNCLNDIWFITSVARRIWLSFICMMKTLCMYWVCAPIVQSNNNATSAMSAVDYEFLHCCMGHPSKDVLKAGQKHIKDFLAIYIPSNEPVCPGCPLGKQPLHP